MKKKFFLLFIAIIVSINYAHAKTSDSLDVKFNLYQKIKMSDGINLSSNVYIPAGVEKKFPTILIITPYISDKNHSRGLFFSRNGYVFITVDSRGRGNSEGEFIPFENDANILIYHSLPLEQDITVNGSIKLEAYISMDVEDTDLRFSAYEITNDNTSIFLQDDFLRARYRDGLEAPKKVPKDKIVKYMFSGRNLFSRTIKKGSRIRLVFSTIDSPSLQKNYNYWIDTSKQVEKNSKKANIKLYHNTKYPSRIIVPYKLEKKQAKNTSR